MIVESFHNRVQKGLRLQIPLLLRWKYKLEVGTVFKAQIQRTDNYKSQKFFTRLQKGGRIGIPRLTCEILELHGGELVEATLWLPDIPEDEREKSILKPLKPITISTAKVPK